jgi:hypothetical protein
VNGTKQLVVFPRGQLTPQDKERLTKNGFMAVEADDPTKVVVAVPGVPLASADDMLMAALSALHYSPYDNVRAKFLVDLFARMKANEAARKGDSCQP